MDNVTAGRRRDDRGVGVVAATLTMGVVLLLITSIVQYVLVAHAQSVARAAAEEGAAEARRWDGSQGAGYARAREFLDNEGGSGLLQSMQVDSDRTETIATVTVRVDVTSIVPFKDSWAITQTVAGPVERYVPEE